MSSREKNSRFMKATVTNYYVAFYVVLKFNRMLLLKKMTTLFNVAPVMLPFPFSFNINRPFSKL